jgi:hypothetical protein
MPTEITMSENMQSCPSCGELVPIEYVLCVWCGYDLTAEHIRRAGIKIGRKEAIDRMKKVVRSPITAFKEITLIPDLTGGKLILYSIGFIMTLSMLSIFSKLENMSYNDEGAGIAINIGTTDPLVISYKFIIGLLFLVLMPLILLLIFNIVWKLSTRIMKWLSKSFGGTGQDEKIRAVIGYSLLPVLFGWLLFLLVIILVPKTTVTNTSSYDAVDAAVVSLTSQGIGVVAKIFLYIGWAWSTILAIIGMQRAARLSLFESIIVAGVPFGLFMLVVL